MILLQERYLTLEYDEQLDCLIQHWKGFTKSNNFRVGIEKSIDFFKEKKPAKLISDTKELAVVSKEDTDWAANYATPIMVDYGLKYMAFVLPNNTFTQFSVNKYKAQTNTMIQVQHFDDLENAKIWLASV